MQTRAAKDLISRSQENITSVIKRIKSAPLTSQTHAPVAQKHAAVLVPLFEDSEGVVRVVLTRRTSKLSTHAGEVALPGGKRDETDVDDEHTALREAEEELGLKEVEVLGHLKPVLSKHLLSVTPVLGKIPSLHSLKPNPDEVDAVFDVPLHTFLETHSQNYSFHDIKEWLGENVSYRVHFFKHGEFTVWGLTAGILIEAASVALGRTPEFQVMPGKQSYTDIVYDGEKIVFKSQSKLVY